MIVFASAILCHIFHYFVSSLMNSSLNFTFKLQSIEIQKRIGAFSLALDTINKCLSEAICALARGRLDGESRTAGLIQSGNEILETYKYYPEVRSILYFTVSFVADTDLAST